jgi:hypothetical protein
MSFVKGVSGNPNGRPQGSKNTFTVDLLRHAIRKVEEKEKVNIFEHFVRRALVNDKVLAVLMNKVMHNGLVMRTEVEVIERESESEYYR